MGLVIATCWNSYAYINKNRKAGTNISLIRESHPTLTTNIPILNTTKIIDLFRAFHINSRSGIVSFSFISPKYIVLTCLKTSTGSGIFNT